MVIPLLANQDLTPMITPKGPQAFEVLMGPFRGFQETKFLHYLERKLRWGLLGMGKIEMGICHP